MKLKRSVITEIVMAQVVVADKRYRYTCDICKREVKAKAKRVAVKRFVRHMMIAHKFTRIANNAVAPSEALAQWAEKQLPRPSRAVPYRGRNCRHNWDFSKSTVRCKRCKEMRIEPQDRKERDVSKEATANAGQA